MGQRFGLEQGYVTPDQERWAEGAMVLRQQGSNAHVFVAERIGALALAGDHAGVDRWKEIARRLQTLLEAPAV